MGTVAIIYFSGSGHTHLMAEAVAEGANQVGGTTVELLRITGEQIQEGRWKDDAMIARVEWRRCYYFWLTNLYGRCSSTI